jgi:hypothetical protein
VTGGTATCVDGFTYRFSKPSTNLCKNKLIQKVFIKLYKGPCVEGYWEQAVGYF